MIYRRLDAELDTGMGQNTSRSGTPRQRVPLLVAIISLAIYLISGCSSTGTSVTDPDPTQQHPQPSLSAANALILLACEGSSVVVQAISPQDGRILASRQVSLPTGVELAYGCGDDNASTQTLRQMFNKDLTILAIRIKGPNDRGFRASAIDLDTGQEIGPGPDTSAFQSAPDDGPPVIDQNTGQLWYVDQLSHRLVSRSPSMPDSSVVDHGPVSDESYYQFQLSGDTPWFERLGSGVMAINPSGTYAVYADNEEVILARKDIPYSQVTYLDNNSFSSHKPIGQPVPVGCGPEFWVDDHHFVCTEGAFPLQMPSGGPNGGNLDEVTITDDFTATTAVVPLLPATDRQNVFPVLSPSRTEFAFLSKHGDQTAIFQQAMSANAQPRKIVDLPNTSNSRYLVEWH
jgi:hypothetical protein